jgi:hypothetical protein
MLCKIEAFLVVGMKNAFWDTKTQFVPHRKHNFSATEPNLLILCKIEAFPVVVMKNSVKNPVRTSQVIHYFSATETNLLILCKIKAFQVVGMKNRVL